MSAEIELPEYAGAVLEVVDTIEPGHALTYGQIADRIGRGGPRQVGAVMATYGHLVTWWRVVRADGSLPDRLAVRALEHWRVEGMPLREGAGGYRVDLSRAGGSVGSE